MTTLSSPSPLIQRLLIVYAAIVVDMNTFMKKKPDVAKKNWSHLPSNQCDGLRNTWKTVSGLFTVPRPLKDFIIPKPRKISDTWKRTASSPNWIPGGEGGTHIQLLLLRAMRHLWKMNVYYNNLKSILPKRARVGARENDPRTRNGNLPLGKKKKENIPYIKKVLST